MFYNVTEKDIGTEELDRIKVGFFHLHPFIKMEILSDSDWLTLVVQCEFVVSEIWEELFPHLAGAEPGQVRLWDWLRAGRS